MNENLNKLSYLFCNKEGHQMNQLNMVCLNQDCNNKGLICCLCLEDHITHSHQCMALQKLVSIVQKNRNKGNWDNMIGEENIEEHPNYIKITQIFNQIQQKLQNFRNEINFTIDSLIESIKKNFEESSDKIKNSSKFNENDIQQFFDTIYANNFLGQSLSQNRESEKKINKFVQIIDIDPETKNIQFFQEQKNTEQKLQEILEISNKNQEILDSTLKKILQDINNQLMPQQNSSNNSNSNSNKSSVNNNSLGTYNNNQQNQLFNNSFSNQNSSSYNNSNQNHIQIHQQVMSFQQQSVNNIQHNSTSSDQQQYEQVQQKQSIRDVDNRGNQNNQSFNEFRSNKPSPPFDYTFSFNDRKYQKIENESQNLNTQHSSYRNYTFRQNSFGTQRQQSSEKKKQNQSPIANIQIQSFGSDRSNQNRHYEQESEESEQISKNLNQTHFNQFKGVFGRQSTKSNQNNTGLSEQELEIIEQKKMMKIYEDKLQYQKMLIEKFTNLSRLQQEQQQIDNNQGQDEDDDLQIVIEQQSDIEEERQQLSQNNLVKQQQQQLEDTQNNENQQNVPRQFFLDNNKQQQQQKSNQQQQFFREQQQQSEDNEQCQEQQIQHIIDDDEIEDDIEETCEPFLNPQQQQREQLLKLSESEQQRKNRGGGGGGGGTIIATEQQLQQRYPPEIPLTEAENYQQQLEEEQQYDYSDIEQQYRHCDQQQQSNEQSQQQQQPIVSQIDQSQQSEQYKAQMELGFIKDSSRGILLKTSEKQQSEKNQRIIQQQETPNGKRGNLELENTEKPKQSKYLAKRNRNSDLDQQLSEDSQSNLQQYEYSNRKQPKQYHDGRKSTEHSSSKQHQRQQPGLQTNVASSSTKKTKLEDSNQSKKTCSAYTDPVSAPKKKRKSTSGNSRKTKKKTKGSTMEDVTNEGQQLPILKPAKGKGEKTQSSTIND